MSTIVAIEQDRQISEVIKQEGPRLRRFIRLRVPNGADAEDLLQEVFYELLRAKRLLMPIDYVTGWLFRVARNRITDFFRKSKVESLNEAAAPNEEGDSLELEDLLPSPDEGPEALYLRHLLLEELEIAMDSLPREQREVFVAHELEGRSFKEIADETGVNMNTLLARKRYAILALRKQLQDVHDEFVKK